MICPKCLEAGEVAYSAVSGSLLCLRPACGWERLLDEEEIFGLFFGSRAGVAGFEPTEVTEVMDALAG